MKDEQRQTYEDGKLEGEKGHLRDPLCKQFDESADIGQGLHFFRCKKKRQRPSPQLQSNLRMRANPQPGTSLAVTVSEISSAGSSKTSRKMGVSFFWISAWVITSVVRIVNYFYGRHRIHCGLRFLFDRIRAEWNALTPFRNPIRTPAARILRRKRNCNDDQTAAHSSRLW